MPAKIDFDALPEAVRKELAGKHGLPAKVSKKVPRGGWSSIPDDWGVCREHGMAWYPADAKCIFCDDVLSSRGPIDVNEGGDDGEYPSEVVQ